jgi:nitroreductase
MNDLTSIIKARRSIRKFEPKPIPQGIIRDILDCARMAPTARNVQPWLFGAINDESVKKQISQLAEYGKFIKDCAVCFAVFCQADAKYLLEDGCAATENILLACSAHGIASCWVAGHKKAYIEDLRKLLNVPASYTLISLVAAGYSDDRPEIKKKALEEVVFFDRYEG